MNFSIPGLDGYFGGKGSSGVPQQIINIIPPHETLIIPFLGHCAITRSIKPAYTTVLFEVDFSVFENWRKFLKSICSEAADLKDFSIFMTNRAKQYELYNSNGIEILEKFNPYKFDKPVIYCDPPYLQSTYENRSKYMHEMTEGDHRRFLTAVNEINFPVLVSHYKNNLYDHYLRDWNTISFMSQTRSGKQRRETVYFNYEKPTELHDYSYFGNNYRVRENNKKRAANLVAKFERMKPLEKNYYLNALTQSGVISHR